MCEVAHEDGAFALDGFVDLSDLPAAGVEPRVLAELARAVLADVLLVRDQTIGRESGRGV